MTDDRHFLMMVLWAIAAVALVITGDRIAAIVAWATATLLWATWPPARP